MPACDGVVHIRRARPTDARAIAEVHVRTWQHAYRDLLPATFLSGLSVDARERFWDAELRVTPTARMPWLAESDGEVTGFVSAGSSRDVAAEPDVGEVYAIYVRPECWDRGLGTDLLRHAERDLLSHGYAAATLWVLADNDRARRFYERAGWTLDGTRTETIGEIELQEVRYRRALDRSRVA
jgi:ribosomal protein S18 acetylase RimI-like enzyme